MPQRPAVPVRTILASIGLVAAAYLSWLLLHELARILAWVVVAAFLAVVLAPVVTFAERRLRLKRGVATILVFVVGVVAVGGMLYTFINPLVREANQFAEEFPGYVEDAKAGRGPVGRIVQRYDLDQYIEEERLQGALTGAGEPALGVLRTVANTLAALLTILVLAVLMLIEGPSIVATALRAIEPEERRERVRRVAADCSRAVTGYMAGNLLISLAAGVTTFVFLTIVGVPFNAVLALWVAFADLIPLVGATLGAVPTVAVAFLHSVPAGLLTVGFFIAYQQFENHVLQVTIMSRTVKLNPLAVLISVLVGVELSGVLGALLAIPLAGIIQVIVRDLWDERRGRLKDEPTIGSEEIPVSELSGNGRRRRSRSESESESESGAPTAARSSKATKAAKSAKTTRAAKAARSGG